MDDEEPPAHALSPPPTSTSFPQTTGGQARIQPQSTGQSSFSQSTLQGTVFPQATGLVSPQATGQATRALSPQSTGFDNNFAASPPQQGAFRLFAHAKESLTSARSASRRSALRIQLLRRQRRRRPEHSPHRRLCDAREPSQRARQHRSRRHEALGPARGPRSLPLGNDVGDQRAAC